MKKIMISLMMVVTVTTTSFAKSNNTDVANYKVKTSLGNFTVNMRKGTITKK